MSFFSIPSGLRKFLAAFVALSSFCFVSGCQINDPDLPSWDVTLNLPISDESYDIFDIIERSNNIGIDSTNGNTVFIYGETKYRRVLGEDVKFDGIKLTNVSAPSTFKLDTSLVFDDSTYILRADFLNGVLRFSFNNSSGTEYTVNAVLRNLFRSDPSKDTVRFSEIVPAGGQRILEVQLSECYLKNDKESNMLRLGMEFLSAQPVQVDFSYELSQYSIRSITGRMRPLNTGKNFDEVLDPFGSDVPEGAVSFATVVPNTNFLVLKRYSSTYQVDFRNITLIGENKNGNRVRLKYLKNGNTGDPVDTVFSLTLPQEQDSLAFPINTDNSNILEFLNNIPKKIFLERVDYINLSYEEGNLSYTDSLTINFRIQVPLDVSITKPVVFTDTLDIGIDDSDLRDEMNKISGMKLNISGRNGLPLKGVLRADIYDSSFNFLLPASFLAGRNLDSTITVGAAKVGADGFVLQTRETTIGAELDSAQIQALKRMGKLVIEYRLFTDPEQIVPPGTTVKVRSSDVTRALLFGAFRYRVEP